MSIQDIQEFIYKWNIKNPIDRWWRKKHSIPFNSLNHRDFSFINMCIEFVEDFLYDEVKKEMLEGGNFYIPGSGNWLKRVKKELSQELIDEMFESINLEDYDENKIL